jgi:hypothetical protein
MQSALDVLLAQTDGLTFNMIILHPLLTGIPLDGADSINAVGRSGAKSL